MLAVHGPLPFSVALSSGVTWGHSVLTGQDPLKRLEGAGARCSSTVPSSEHTRLLTRQ